MSCIELYYLIVRLNKDINNKKNNKKMKTATHQHLNGNRLVQLIRVGHSIWHIWVKVLQCQNQPIQLNKIVRHIILNTTYQDHNLKTRF